MEYIGYILEEYIKRKYKFEILGVVKRNPLFFQ